MRPRYAGINITRNIVLAMAISGALAGLAGTIEVLGVSICRCLPLFFSSGYGFDSIAIALLAKNNPFGILARVVPVRRDAQRRRPDGAQLGRIASTSSRSSRRWCCSSWRRRPIVRWIYRIKAERRPEEEAPLTRGWGG